jgi:two-component system nitrogen regulation sensor histidine kinase NtrY
MRLRFAIAGHAPKAEAKPPPPETKPPAPETIEPQETTNPDTTNNEAKIEAATGN